LFNNSPFVDKVQGAPFWFSSSRLAHHFETLFVKCFLKAHYVMIFLFKITSKNKLEIFVWCYKKFNIAKNEIKIK
jgi:hypothetical protein